jgi:myo-inositol 2-dehydrogenase / D-chiro-inositol 1-dehydrogenase
MQRTRVLLLGAGFIADIHAESYRRFVPDAVVVGVCSRREEHARAFAQKHGIARWFTRIDDALGCECDVVDVCLPNHLHAAVTIAAAAAGKHVIVEKPLCLSLDEADAMIEACTSHKRKLMYAEELCFAPKYERVRQLAADGAIGSIYYLRQCEKHSGPHSDWFYDLDQSGGGALMDMGCHGLAWLQWMLGRDRRPLSIQAHMQTGLLHGARTRCEEHAVCLVEFEGNVVGVVENSWAKLGGMDDRIEVCGTGGVIYADLFMGNSALTYSANGYGYAMEKAGSTQGWTFTNVEEAFNQGYPHELQHFIECVRTDASPLTTGEDGRAVLDLLNAAYYSARRGEKVPLPFAARPGKPIDLWLAGAITPS